MFAQVSSDAGVLPDYFLTMLLAIVVVAVVAFLLSILAWRGIDWITPGKLNEELVPSKPNKHPNVALAIVVGARLFLDLRFLVC